jgi:hypothetical protein
MAFRRDKHAAEKLNALNKKLAAIHNQTKVQLPDLEIEDQTHKPLFQRLIFILMIKPKLSFPSSLIPLSRRSSLSTIKPKLSFLLSSIKTKERQRIF